jgi:hypothetical protein
MRRSIIEKEQSKASSFRKEEKKPLRVRRIRNRQYAIAERKATDSKGQMPG